MYGKKDESLPNIKLEGKTRLIAHRGLLTSIVTHNINNHVNHHTGFRKLLGND